MSSTENSFTTDFDFEEAATRAEPIIAYRQGEMPLISDAPRAALDPGNDSWRDHDPYETEYGVGAIPVDDSRVKLVVNAKRFRKLAFSRGVLGGWNGATAASLVAQTFNRLFWIASYCAKKNYALEKRQVAGIFRAADAIVGILGGTDDVVMRRLSCLDEGSLELFSPRGLETLPPEKRSLFFTGELLLQVERLHESIDLLLADCAMRETVKATLQALQGRADKERVLDRLNDEDIAWMFEDVRKRCNIVEAVKAMKEAVKGNTEAVEVMKETVKENTEAVKDAAMAVEAVKGTGEQNQDAAHFPKTGTRLTFAEAAYSFWRAFRDEIRTQPGCEDSPEKHLPQPVSEQSQARAKRKTDVSQNLQQRFRKRIKDSGLKCEDKDRRRSRQKKEVDDLTFDLAEYYEIMCGILKKPALQGHFWKRETFDKVSTKIMDYCQQYQDGLKAR